MNFLDLAFMELTVVTVVAAALAVEDRNSMRAAFFLGIVIVNVGLFFLVMGAQFIGLIQILIYGGGVTIVMLFAMAMRYLETENRAVHRPSSLIVSAAVFALASYFVTSVTAFLSPSSEKLREVALIALKTNPFALILLAASVAVMIVAASYLTGGAE